jgi:hypothetical protein
MHASFLPVFQLRRTAVNAVSKNQRRLKPKSANATSIGTLHAELIETT